MIFVYRSHYDGPLSKRVRVRPDASVLAWFQRGWYERDHDQWLAAEVGDDVYGLHSIFDAAREHDLAVPRTLDDLHRLLTEHLYVEGELRMDARTLRVLTDDDEVALAYFFMDDLAVTEAPDRTAYLVHPQWPLPGNAGAMAAGGFTASVTVRVAAPDAGGPGATYVVLLTFHDSDSIPGPGPLVFPGVRLPGFPARLRAADAHTGWPPELEALRAQTSDDSVEAALTRVNRELSKNPDRSFITVDEHIGQLAMHHVDYFGYHQWFLFDDVWASSHPELAASLLRYATHWDPFGG